MPPRRQLESDPLQLGAWERIIRSVTSLFGFVTLLILAFATVLPVLAARDGQNQIFYISAYIGVLLILVGAIFWTAYTRPWLLSIDAPYGRDFPKRVATEFTDLIYPYFSNSKTTAVEQLNTWREGLVDCEQQFEKSEEQKFIEEFRTELLRRGEKRISAIPTPTSQSTTATKKRGA
jgi:hypothetical protein